MKLHTKKKEVGPNFMNELWISVFLEANWEGGDKSKHQYIGIKVNGDYHEFYYEGNKVSAYLPEDMIPMVKAKVVGEVMQELLSEGTKTADIVVKGDYPELEDNAIKFTKEVINIVEEGKVFDLKQGGDFYDQVNGTSAHSHYVLVAKSKVAGSSYVAMRIKGDVISIRVDPVPTTESYLEAMKLLGLNTTNGTHWSAHINIPSALVMKRFLMLFKGTFEDLYDICGMDLEHIKKMGA